MMKNHHSNGFPAMIKTTAVICILSMLLATAVGCGRSGKDPSQSGTKPAEEQSVSQVTEQPAVSGTDAPQSGPAEKAPLALVSAANPTYQKNERGARVWQDAIEYSEEDGSQDSLLYTKTLLPAVLNDTQKNAAFSPLSLYFALASVAELSYGDTRDQILKLLDAPSMEALRTTAQAVWLNLYTDEKNYYGETQRCFLSSSLWLNNAGEITLDPPTAELLKKNFFTSLYAGNAADPAYQKMYSEWLNEKTGGLLKEQLKDAALSPDSVFSLVNTLFLQESWMTPFKEAENTEEPFYGANGSSLATFMHNIKLFGFFYEGTGYTATYINTYADEKVWLLLPDVNESPASIIRSGAYLDVLSKDVQETAPPEGYDGYSLHLALPKFDISASYDLKEPLLSLGVTDMFSADKADFRFIETSDDTNLRLTNASQDVRIEINEKGISAAAATLMEGGFGDPVFYDLDFMLDRPFLVLVTSDCNTPLFVAAVNDIAS